MKKFLETLRNIWKIEDLKQRILTTLGLLLIFRIGSFVVLPGVDPNGLSAGGGLADFISLFTGGAFSRASIFALGIMPYISASIIMQLMGMAVPAIQKLQREGESGQKRINQWTRILTIAICGFQAPGYLATMIPPQARMTDSMGWVAISVLILVAGTMFVMWIGERITDKGLGNGISLLIMIGIIAGLPAAFLQEFLARADYGGMVLLLFEIVFLLAIILFSILLVQGTRKIPIQFAKRYINQGNRQVQAGGARQYIPLKVNSAGVMPIIFAQAIMFVPSAIQNASFSSEGVKTVAGWFSDFNGLGYNLLFAFLIIIFSYFYTAITVKTNEMAASLKRSNGFIPGVRPGKDTDNYLDNILSLITFPGSIFLALLAILPAFVGMFGVSQGWAMFYGGTSLIIMVGVSIDTIQQINAHLLNRHYDGLMKTGTKRKTGL